MKTGKYMVGQIENISSGGAMVIVDRPSLLVSGQRLAAGIAWNDHQMLIGTDEMIGATVIRSLGLGRMQHVAIQFDEIQPLQTHGSLSVSG